MLPQSYQDLLHRVVPIPLRNATKSRQLDLSILLVDAGEINLRDEFNGGRLVRITTAAIDLKIVDAVLVCAMRRAEDGRVPVGHHHIVAISEAVRASVSTETLLALLELFEQTEIPGNLCRHNWECTSM